jgi:hypothetical protein
MQLVIPTIRTVVRKYLNRVHKKMFSKYDAEN